MNFVSFLPIIVKPLQEKVVQYVKANKTIVAVAVIVALIIICYLIQSANAQPNGFQAQTTKIDFKPENTANS